MIRILPVDTIEKLPYITYSLDISDKITKSGRCVIVETIDKLRKAGFDVKNFESKKRCINKN